MYKLFTVTVATFALVACGTTEDQGMTFEMAETSAEFAYCFDYQGTEYCFDRPVECFPNEDGMECVATPVEQSFEVNRELPTRISDELWDAPGVDINTPHAEAVDTPMELEDDTAELVRDELSDFDVRGVDIEKPETVVDPDFIDRVCDVCSADPSSGACDLCAAAHRYAEVVEAGDVDEDWTNDEDGHEYDETL